MSKKLYRSRNDRMIAGVCGGVADYFDVDSSLIRLAVLFIFLFQGVGLIAYLIAWLIISEEPVRNESKLSEDYYVEVQEEKPRVNNNNRRKLFAVIMILIGLTFLIDIWIPRLYWEKFWPLMLIAFGVLMLKGDNNDK